jgi:sulfur transfer complex TusBCD TusB component (DsrH family)
MSESNTIQACQDTWEADMLAKGLTDEELSAAMENILKSSIVEVAEVPEESMTWGTFSEHVKP